MVFGWKHELEAELRMHRLALKRLRGPFVSSDEFHGSKLGAAPSSCWVDGAPNDDSKETYWSMMTIMDAEWKQFFPKSGKREERN